jgi:hypothetical protein
MMMVTNAILQLTVANVPKPTVHITAAVQYACQYNLRSECFWREQKEWQADTKMCANTLNAYRSLYQCLVIMTFTSYNLPFWLQLDLDEQLT